MQVEDAKKVGEATTYAFDFNPIRYRRLLFSYCLIILLFNYAEETPW